MYFHANALDTLLTARFLQTAPILPSVAAMLLVAMLFSNATMYTTGWRLV